MVVQGLSFQALWSCLEVRAGLARASCVVNALSTVGLCLESGTL